MDSFALGYKLADRIIKDGRIDEFVKNRYASYTQGIGKDIVEGKADLESLSAYAVTLGEINVESGRQEYLEGIINELMFKGV